jgi:23S rRNA (cytidine1920-2'-O)/16S rRNA (cytidine1409-2'-O)-methyltransferase
MLDNVGDVFQLAVAKKGNFQHILPFGCRDAPCVRVHYELFTVSFLFLKFTRNIAMAKLRLDLLLVAQGLAESRTKAQGLIMAGLVYRGETKLDKAGFELPEETEITVRGKEHPWVSRGGVKLAHALEEFGLDVAGMVAIDVGASTGGFTDVLLTRGAAKVYAVDVGHGQLDVKLRGDPRVVVMESTNARHLTRAMLDVGENPPNTGNACPLDLVVCDASFISLTKVLPAALALARVGASLVTLIKPQFEVGKMEVSRGKGVIRDPGLHAQVRAQMAEWVAAQCWQVKGEGTSPITGPKGNVEFLLWAVKETRTV